MLNIHVTLIDICIVKINWRNHTAKIVAKLYRLVFSVGFLVLWSSPDYIFPEMLILRPGALLGAGLVVPQGQPAAFIKELITLPPTCVRLLEAQSSLTLHDPMNCSLPGSSVHGIFQARVLEWGAIAFSENCHTTQQSHCWAYTLKKPE